jgi:hypothetical protein
MAEFVLGGLMPALEQRQHLVIMHDISDGRYSPINPDYQGKRLWRGDKPGHSRLYLNYLDTLVEQTVSIIDFTSRNGLTLESADHSLQSELSRDQIAELKIVLGDQFFRLDGHWFYFSLNEKTAGEKIYFPGFHSDSVLQERQERSQAESYRSQAESYQSQVAQLQGEVNHLKTLLTQAEADTGLANLLKKAWRKYKAFRSQAR